MRRVAAAAARASMSNGFSDEQKSSLNHYLGMSLYTAERNGFLESLAREIYNSVDEQEFTIPLLEFLQSRMEECLGKEGLEENAAKFAQAFFHLAIRIPPDVLAKEWVQEKVEHCLEAARQINYDEIDDFFREDYIAEMPRVMKMVEDFGCQVRNNGREGL